MSSSLEDNHHGHVMSEGEHYTDREMHRLFGTILDDPENVEKVQNALMNTYGPDDLLYNYIETIIQSNIYNWIRAKENRRD